MVAFDDGVEDFLVVSLLASSYKFRMAAPGSQTADPKHNT